MQLFRIRDTTRGGPGKLHVMRYAEVPDKDGYYIFWCGTKAHKDNVEKPKNKKITCGLCAIRVKTREQRQLKIKTRES